LYEGGLSHEKIARALSLSKGVIAKYVERLERTGLAPEQLLAREALARDGVEVIVV
jgi:transposase